MDGNNVRETKEVKVGTHVLILNTYLTGRELRSIQGAMLNNLEMKQGAGGVDAEISGFKGELIQIQEDKQLEAVIVSIDGKTEGIINLVLDLPASEYSEIVELVKEIAEKKEQASR